MRDMLVDFRPPTLEESWNWTMDLAPFESDASGIPDGSDLQYRRGALLLEYLPGAKWTEDELVTRELAVEALSGMQEIQKL